MGRAHSKQRCFPLPPEIKRAGIHVANRFIGEIGPLIMGESLAADSHISVTNKAPITNAGN